MTAKARPPRGIHARLVGGGAVVLAGLLAWNAGNYAFFLIAGRLLGPSDYGLVAALLAVSVVVLVPCGALQYGIARRVAGTPGDALARGAVYRRAWWRALVVSTALGAAAALVLGAAGLAGVDGMGPLLATIPILAPMGVLMLSLGQLQGEERFGPLAVSMGLIGAPRPLLILALALLTSATYAALLGSALASVAAAAAAAAFTWRLLRHAPAPDASEWRAFSRTLAPLAVGLTGIALLTNLDVVVAKLALDDVEAGQFGAIAVLAKAVILVPQTTSVVLLPRIAARRAAGRDTGPLLLLGLASAVLAGGLGSLVCLFASDPIVRITFGEEYTDNAGLLPAFVAASALLGGLTVLVNHHASRQADRFVWMVGGLAVVQVAAFALFHSRPEALIAVDAAVAGIGIVVHEIVHRGSGDSMIRAAGALLARKARGG